jgi:hypothetical protein
MAACHDRKPDIRFEIFTLVPEWFFAQSLRGPFRYHPLLTDLGLVQVDPLHEDLRATWDRLKRFFPFRASLIEGLARELEGLACRLVLCDIAPMGIAAAKATGVPSVLVENFTWDWIYEGYEPCDQEVRDRIAWLGSLFREADHHVQTEPVCRYRPSASLLTRPVSRRPRLDAAHVRRQLEVAEGSRLVMVTMGGAGTARFPLEILRERPEIQFLIPGGNDRAERRDNVLLIPHDSGLFHPDLIHASDAVIGKVGYSTVSEVYHAGIPFLHISRPAFRESRVLALFLQACVPGFSIEESEFMSGAWTGRLEELLSCRHIRREGRNGAEEIADLVLDLLAA